MKLLLRYHQRLGDIIQCLSMGKQLVERGYEVYLECNREYHSIFKLCPYVMPVYPGQQPPRGFKFDHIVDPQIWPAHYNAYRKSELKWWAFVTSLHPLLNGLEWSNPFEPALIPVSPLQKPETLCVIAHTGFSQVPKIDPGAVVALARRLYPHLTPITLGNNSSYRAGDLCDLVALVQKAAAVVTINTSVDYMADSTRTQYDHIINTGFNRQDDFESEKQTRHLL